MSVFLEILKCILCCEEDQHHGDNDDWRDPPRASRFFGTFAGNSFASRYHLLQSESMSRTQSYHSTNTISSPLLTSSKARPAASPGRLVQSRSVLGPSTTSSPSRLNTVERTNEVRQSSTTSSSYTTYSPRSSMPPNSSSQTPSSSLPYVKPTKSFLNPSAPSHSELPSPSTKPLPSLKPTLSRASSKSSNKDSYILVGASPTYMIPKNIIDLIKKDIVPGVLEHPLSPSTYSDYFSALLYAEDYYIEKWCKFQLENVKLKLEVVSVYKRSGKNRQTSENKEKEKKIFVAFEVDSVPERRPFLLSRDFVFAQPSGRKLEPFRGLVHRVVRSTTVLVEFGDDFHSQHHPTCKYDISFSFNRVCLKRAHQAIAAASDPSFQSFIFPDSVSHKRIASSAPYILCNYKLDLDQKSTVHQILDFQGSPPYLVEGPLCVTDSKLSRTGIVVQEVIFQLYKQNPKHHILVCAPINNTCDELMSSLKKKIPESDMFRANAAFREIDGVPLDILPSCLYKGECFTCPSIQEFRKYRIIFSTFVSSFRLHHEGITAGHFSHIFLVDASSATEPEVMVALANLATERTAVIVTGAPGNCSKWVRSEIARRNGLKESYFERLCASYPYRTRNSSFISRLVNSRDNPSP